MRDGRVGAVTLSAVEQLENSDSGLVRVWAGRLHQRPWLVWVLWILCRPSQQAEKPLSVNENVLLSTGTPVTTVANEMRLCCIAYVTVVQTGLCLVHHSSARQHLAVTLSRDSSTPSVSRSVVVVVVDTSSAMKEGVYHIPHVAIAAMPALL